MWFTNSLFCVKYIEDMVDGSFHLGEVKEFIVVAHVEELALALIAILRKLAF